MQGMNTRPISHLLGFKLLLMSAALTILSGGWVGIAMASAPAAPVAAGPVVAQALTLPPAPLAVAFTRSSR